MNILKKSLKESIEVIKKHKLIFLILFFTQLVFLIISSLTFVNFSVSIGENMQAFLEPLEAIANIPEEQMMNLADSEVMDSLEPMFEKYGYYNQIIKNLTLFVVSMYIIYIIINGINWDMSNLMVNKKSPFLEYQVKFAILVFIFTLPIIAFINITMQYVFNIEQIQIAVPIYILVMLIALYFMYLSFASINKVKMISHYPTIIKDAFLTGVKKAHILFPVLLITTGIPALLIYIISTQLEANFLLLLSLIGLFVLLINWGRIIFLLVVKHLEKID